MSPTAYGPEVIRLVAGRVLRVGRAATADVQLEHPAVSRHHAELIYDGRTARVRDLGGPAGTRVNRQRIRSGNLSESDRVDFGPVAYEYGGGQLRRLDNVAGVRLEVRGLGVQRGGKMLLSRVSLDCQPGTFVGVLGPSGAGKSTLLRCLAGFLPTAAGEVRYDGTVLAADRCACQAQAGYVPQDDIVFQSLTCRENLGYALALRSAGDLSSAEREDVIRLTLGRVGLDKLIDRRAGKLSGGERKRLNVALELLGRPRLLFLDEPTSGLDPATESKLMRVLRRLAGGGTTVICSTHVLENLALFDQVVVVAGSTVAFRGPPSLLLPHFHVKDYPALYEALEKVPASPAPPAAPSAARSTVAAGPQSQRPLRQCATLLVRGLHLLCRDPVLLVLLLLQPVLIGLLINLSQVKPEELKAVFLFGVVAAFWLGLSNTAREVVRDRPVYARERLLGVSVLNYLAAKVLLFALVGLGQVLLMATIVRYLYFMPRIDGQYWAEHTFWYFALVLWTTNLGGLLLGLLVSTLARTQEAAVAALPLLVLPQLLLSGVATNLEEKEKGRLGSLVVLVNRVRPEHELTRPAREVAVEATSLLTYSRPGVVLLHRPPARWRRAAQVVAWLHQTLVVLITASGLLAAFYWTERGWLERV